MCSSGRWVRVRVAATVTARPVNFELGQIARLWGEAPVNGMDMQQRAIDSARRRTGLVTCFFIFCTGFEGELANRAVDEHVRAVARRQQPLRDIAWRRGEVDAVLGQE